MNKYYFLIYILFFTTINSSADIVKDIKVRLFSTYNGDKAIVTVIKGDYFLIALNNKGIAIDTIAKVSATDSIEKTLFFQLKSNKILLNKKSRKLGEFYSVYFKAVDDSSSFIIKYEDQKERFYDGSLFFKKNNKNLEVVNYVALESYVAGVVESEVGNSGNTESYKVQAILARTYAIKNFDKFINYGYNLTDDVRSQVYFSKSYYVQNNIIIDAVKQTENKIIVDYNNKIILPAFHANSGGQTINAKEVWVKNLPYLKSIKDPYSSAKTEDSTHWEVEVPIDKFLFYFYKQAPQYKKSNKYKNAILSFKQKSRKANFTYKNVQIPLKNIRTKFKLRSTFFDISSRNDKVVISGKGYGHGVGLSQVGAINMGKRGFSCVQIINFYYKNVKVVDYNNIIIPL